MLEKKLEVSIGTNDNNEVIMKFSEKIAWLAFTPKEAIEMAEHLKERAEKLLIKG